MVARVGDQAALLPFDTLWWTERLAGNAREIGGRARQELGATSLEVRMPGSATPRGRAELAQAGWGLKEGVTAGLLTLPFP